MLIANPGSVAAYVRDRRIARGMSQADLAEKIGMSRQWVVRFEGGGADVATIGHLFRIADALLLDIDMTDYADMLSPDPAHADEPRGDEPRDDDRP